MYKRQTQKMALGCDQDSCLAELGGALGVPYMLVSNLGRFGQQYILNIKFVAVQEAKVLGRVNKILADEAKVLEALPQALQEVVNAGLGTAEAAPQATAVAAAPAPAPVSAPAAAAAPVTRAAPSRGGVLTRPLLWIGVGVMAGGAGAGYWSQQSVIQAKDSYEELQIVAQDEPTRATLEQANNAWDDSVSLYTSPSPRD